MDISDTESFLRYKRPPGFKFEFPPDKKWVWVQQGKGSERHYVVAEVLKTIDSEKQLEVRIKDSTEVKVVDEEEVDGVNPAKFDGVDDCAMLGYLSQASVLHNLRLRFDANIIYTYSGLFLVSVNPYAWFPIYTPEVIKRYANRRRAEVPPHVYAVADEAYRSLLRDKKSQSMLVTGESGAGKTENTKKVIQYLAAIGGRSSGGSTLEQKILQANPLLEAFGNAKTLKNNNSSRFGKFIKITFDTSGLISGSSIVPYLLERSRVVTRGQDERTFHIFYQLLVALPEPQKSKLRLTRPEDYTYLTCSGENYSAEGISDEQEFSATKFAMDTLGFSPEEQDLIFRVVSAILHVGNITFEGEEQARVVDETPAQVAAELLQIDPKALIQALVAPRINVGKEMVAKGMTPWQAERSRDAMAKALYGRMFLWVVDKINATLTVQPKDQFIGILDIAGFEIFRENSFEQMCINFTNERLQQFFNNHMFNLEQEEYRKEKIEWVFVDFGIDSQATIDLIQKKPRGILVILDEECLFPKATDTSFVEKLDKAHNKRNPKFRREQTDGATSFAIEHYAGKVDYDSTMWLEKNKDPLQDDLGLCISNSKDPLLVYFWKSFGTLIKVGASFATVGALYRQQLDDLMDTLGSTYPHFIRCIIPNHKKMRGYLDFAVVLDQLACNGVLEGIKISRLGFPNRMPYAEFQKRYYLLVPNLSSKQPDSKAATMTILQSLVSSHTISPDNYRFGVTKIFFRSGEMAKVEESREKVVGEMVGVIQAAARGYLGRKIYERMCQRLAGTLVIQRNVRVWLENRNSPWWKLMSKIRSPEVRMVAERERLEREMKMKLEALQEQIEKVGREKVELQKIVDRLNSDTEAIKEELTQKRLRATKLQEDTQEIYLSCKEIDKQGEETLSRLNEKEKELKKTREEASALQTAAKLIQVKIEEVQIDQQRINDLINLDRTEKARVLTTIEEARDQVKTLQLNLSNQENELEQRREVIHSLIEKKATLSREKVDFETRLHAQTQLKKDLEGDISKLLKSIDTLTLDLRNLRPTYEGIQKRRKETDATVEAMTTDKNNLERRLEDQIVNSNRLNNDMKIMKEEALRGETNLNQERKAIKELGEKFSQLSVEFSQTEDARAKMEVARVAMGSRKAAAERRLEELKPLLRDALIKVDRLNKEISNLSTESAEFQKQNEDLNQQISKLEKAIAKMEASASEFSEKVKSGKSSSTKTEQQSKKLDTKISEVKKILSEEKSKKEKITENGKKLSEEKSRLISELEVTRIEVENMSKEHHQEEAHVQDLEQERAKLANTSTTISRKQAAILKDRTELREHMDDLTAQRHKLTDQKNQIHEIISAQSGKLTEQREIRGRTDTRVKQAESEIVTCREKLSQLEKDNEVLGKKVSVVEQEEKQRRTEFHQLEDGIQEQTKKGNNFEAELREEQRTLENRLTEVIRMEGEVRNTSIMVDDLIFAVDNSSKKNVALDRENKATQEKIAALKDKLETEIIQKNRARALVAELSQEVVDRRQSAADAKTQETAEDRARQVAQEIKATKEEIGRILDSKNTLQTELRDLLYQAQAVRTEIASVRVDHEVSERDKRNINQRIQLIGKEFSAISTANEQLEKRIIATERKAAKITGGKKKSDQKKTPVVEPDTGTTGEPTSSPENEELPPAEVETSGEGQVEQKPPKEVYKGTSKDDQLRALKDEGRHYVNDIKNERRAYQHYDRQVDALETELSQLHRSVRDAANTNANLRRTEDTLKEEVDLLKGGLLADQEIMEILRKTLEEISKEIEKDKNRLETVQKERDVVQNRVDQLRRDLLLVTTELRRETHCAQSARTTRDRNNHRLTVAVTDERAGTFGADDSPLPSQDKRPTTTAIRRETLRALQTIKKLRSRLKTSVAEKEEQDKITWQLQDEAEALRRDVHDATLAREISERERETLRRLTAGAEEAAKEATSQCDRNRRVAGDLCRELDHIKDELAATEESNAIFERQREKHQKTIRALEQELEFARQRHVVAAEEAAAAELGHKKMRRAALDEEEGLRIAEGTLAKLEEQLTRARADLGLKRVLLTQEEREYEILGKEYSDIIATIDQIERQHLIDPDHVRLEKQCLVAKEQLAQEKAKGLEARNVVRNMEDEIEVLKFDMKTLRNDIAKTRAELKRLTKARDEIRSLTKRVDDKDLELELGLSSGEDEHGELQARV